MAKYLVKAKYTATAGVRGLLEDGGTERVAAVRTLIESVGGTLEAFYFGLGEVDAYVIADVPDTASGVALSLAVSASGLATVETVLLITAEEIDAAVKKTPMYDAPGKADNQRPALSAV
jgi:uncharacterized protein with GYD domain